MSKVTEAAIAIAKGVWARKPNCEELHVTSDGQVFMNPSHAAAQAGNLHRKGGSDEVVTLKRIDVMKEDEATTGGDAPKTEGEPTGGEATTGEPAGGEAPKTEGEPAGEPSGGDAPKTEGEPAGEPAKPEPKKGAAGRGKK